VYGPAETDHLSNQFAAMPSLHFGWALMVAIGLIAATRSRWRWLWLLHPLVTLLVIVGTANHYWLDAIVAAALLGIALAVIRDPAPDRTGGPPRGRRSSGWAGGTPTRRRRAGAGARGSRPMSATLVAVVLSLFSAVAYAAAAVAQERLAARTSDAGAATARPGAWWWSVGLNASARCCTWALKYGPLTVVQPLGALTLVAAVPLGARVAGRRVTFGRVARHRADAGSASRPCWSRRPGPRPTKC
jgi:hypothetical protein